MHTLIDIGANLTHESFDGDREDVIRRAAAASVTRFVITGTTVEASIAARDLSRTHRGICFATAGIHPHHASEFDDASGARLADLLADPCVVAAGECGLDYFRDFSARTDQRRAFAAQLELAAAARRPVFLHQRDAHADFLAVLRPARDSLPGGVAHCFTGGRDELRDYLDLGLYIGVTGWVCDERRGGALREALPEVPLDRLLLETDAPYLLPRDLKPRPKSRRNEPMYLAHVLERVARETNRSAGEVAAASTANAERLFGLPP